MFDFDEEDKLDGLDEDKDHTVNGFTDDDFAISNEEDGFTEKQFLIDGYNVLAVGNVDVFTEE